MLIAIFINSYYYNFIIKLYSRFLSVFKTFNNKKYQIAKFIL